MHGAIIDFEIVIPIAITAGASFLVGVLVGVWFSLADFNPPGDFRRDGVI